MAGSRERTNGHLPALRRAWRRALHDDVSAPDAPVVGLRPLSRREFVTWGATASVALVGSRGAFAAPRPRSLDVGIVGAGLAGLACADRLAASGFAPAVYEASDRVGGRCYSLRGFFPGQVAQRGGEFIDNPHKTSSLNFLLFIHADRRSKFTPFGVSSDERWHLTGGNDAIALGLASALARPVQFVLALPFSVLRTLDLAPSLAVPPDKRLAIDGLGYGTNAKMMVGFAGRPWAASGSNGSSYSDLESHQTTWETNPTAATSSRAVLTDYSSGRRGATLNPARDQQEATAFLSDLDLVYPGAFTQATRDSRGRLLVHLEHWPSNPLSRGSYTCYRPGQFTTIAGLEATPVGNVFFAGEHADSFYSWQGFMEGAALSGIAAADALQGR